jgi:hypothetical protein
MTTPTILPSEPFLHANDFADCEAVRDELLHSWLEVPGDAQSPAFLQHLRRCRRCLQTLIALEAAADLTFETPRITRAAR